MLDLILKDMLLKCHTYLFHQEVEKGWIFVCVAAEWQCGVDSVKDGCPGVRAGPLLTGECPESSLFLCT